MGFAWTRRVSDYGPPRFNLDGFARIDQCQLVERIQYCNRYCSHILERIVRGPFKTVRHLSQGDPMQTDSPAERSVRWARMTVTPLGLSGQGMTLCTAIGGLVPQQ